MSKFRLPELVIGPIGARTINMAYTLAQGVLSEMSVTLVPSDLRAEILHPFFSRVVGSEEIYSESAQSINASPPL